MQRYRFYRCNTTDKTYAGIDILYQLWLRAGSRAVRRIFQRYFGAIFLFLWVYSCK